MSGLFGAPLPTNDGGIGAEDLVNAQGTSLSQDFESSLSLAENSADRLGKWLGSVWDNSQITEKSLALLGKVLAWIVLEVAKVEADVLIAWIQFEESIYAAAVAPLEHAAAVEATSAVGLLLKAMGGSPGQGANFGSSEMASVAQTMFNQIVQPFTLVNSGLDPSQHGSGVQAQQYLLEKAMGLSLQEWIVEQLGNHMGMSFFKSLGPFLSIVDRSVHPSNIVRQAVDSSLTFLLKAPLTRDLNRQYPIKDLGLTALAKLFIRGAIDQTTYLDKCLDTGLSSTWANQLVLESATLLNTNVIAKLLSLGFIQQSDAETYLAHRGYQPADVTAQLYYDTHQRYFALQERVGEKAVNAFAHGIITQAQLEEILPHLGFTSDEIQLLEMEQQFVKLATKWCVNLTGPPVPKCLSYGQIKAMYDANIIGIDDVITSLEMMGYNPTDTINLVVLDFTVESERAARQNLMMARLRATAQADIVSAAAEQAKNEGALANAKLQLAQELEAEANALGTPLVTGGVLATLGLV
jgi:hypothetical protein